MRLFLRLLIVIVAVGIASMGGIAATSATSQPASAEPVARPEHPDDSTRSSAVTPPVDPQEHEARRLLDKLESRYPLLEGTTISVGETPDGYEAVSYYTSGRIVVSPDQTAGLERVLAHEIWHIIDWRDNGRIDWDENLPPHDASNYAI